MYLARVYLRQEGEAEIDYREIRALLELAEPVNPCGQLYAMLSSCCDQLGDAAAAMKYLKKLHKLAPDDAQCCIALARNYAMGCGTRLDYELALRYYQKAANLGDSYGVFMVGLMYYEGCGVRRNYKRAVDFFFCVLWRAVSKSLCIITNWGQIRRFQIAISRLH